MKLCNKCNKHKLETEFSWRNKPKGKLNVWCRECMKAYDKNRKSDPDFMSTRKKQVAKRRHGLRKKLIDYLNQNPCIECGETDHIVLEFDHLRDKSFNVSDGVKRGYAWDTIKKEINKCQVLCANCHRRKTAKDFGWYKDNGQ